MYPARYGLLKVVSVVGSTNSSISTEDQPYNALVLIFSSWSYSTMDLSELPLKILLLLYAVKFVYEVNNANSGNVFMPVLSWNAVPMEYHRH